MDFQPNKLIKSRYSISNINSNNYMTMPISGGTVHQVWSGGTFNQGFVFAPYQIVDLPPIWFDREWRKHKLLEDRKDKFVKLGW